MPTNAEHFNRKEINSTYSEERENLGSPKTEFSKKINCIDENHLGKSLKEVRLSLNLTQSEASNLINVTQAQWSAYELGKTKPTIDTILNISEKLKIDPFLLINKTVNRFIYFNANKEKEPLIQEGVQLEHT